MLSLTVHTRVYARFSPRILENIILVLFCFTLVFYRYFCPLKFVEGCLSTRVLNAGSVKVIKGS